MNRLPVYIVVDTSSSLMGQIDQINGAIAELFDALRSDPLVASSMSVAIVQFDDEAYEVLALSNVRDVDTPPELLVGGRTELGSAFRLVRRLIVRDVAALKADGQRVYRPLLFLVTDGSPSGDDWRAALLDIQRPQFREGPTIVAFGIGSVDPDILREIGAGGGSAFMVSAELDTGAAIRSIFDGLAAMFKSTVQSSISPHGRSYISVPEGWIDVTAVSEDR